MKNHIYSYLLAFRLLRAALNAFWSEFKYYLIAKIPVFAPPSRRSRNTAMLVRKRAHHLERFLVEPDAYPHGFGESAANDLKQLFGHYADDISPDCAAWAGKMLKEYEAGVGNEVLCPMLKRQVERPPVPISKENLMSLLKQRRSRRVFEDTPLSKTEKAEICQAAQYAPSSCNRQSLELIFVEDPELKSFISSTIPGGKQFFHRAPCILVIVSDARDYRYPDERVTPFIDGGAAVQNIYLICETMGLGCCAGSYTSFGNIGLEAEVRVRLNIPPTHIIVGSMAIGRSNQFVCDIPRDPAKTRYGVNLFRSRGK
jgi:nitroreductase